MEELERQLGILGITEEHLQEVGPSAVRDCIRENFGERSAAIFDEAVATSQINGIRGMNL